MNTRIIISGSNYHKYITYSALFTSFLKLRIKFKVFLGEPQLNLGVVPASSTMITYAFMTFNSSTVVTTQSINCNHLILQLLSQFLQEDWVQLEKEKKFTKLKYNPSKLTHRV